MNRRPLLAVRRREMLKGLLATAAMPFAASLFGARAARADAGQARRVIFFYFPDGVPGPSSNGEASAWHATGSEHAFQLSSVLAPLEPWRDRCVFLNGLSMGATDSGSHPGGAKKLLTAVDGGNGWSIDHWLSENVGAAAPYRHLYLGAMANQAGGGDKQIVYVGNGQTITPEDNPVSAFARVFGDAGAVTTTTQGQASPALRRKRKIVDAMRADLTAFQSRIGGAESQKLDLHLQSLSELDARIAALEQQATEPTTSSCGSPSIDMSGVDTHALYEAARFPAILKAQIDVMVNAMACNLTRVGTLQASYHTSELIMSRFAGTEMSTPDFDMRSHQASHYGPSHDVTKNEYDKYVKQRRWFVSQLAYLLEQLHARPEGDGTMLDHTVVLLCTEVCDGNTHVHDNMPFVLAGGAGGAWSTGRLLQFGYERHGKLLTSIARSMGAALDGFGDGPTGGLAGLL